MLQPKKTIKKVIKKPVSPVDSYKNMVDPATGKKGTMGGEGTRPPFDKDSPVTPLPGRKAKNMPKAKSGATVKKAQYGVDMTAGTEKMAKGGSLKAVNKTKNPGLSKLPTVVRNKMGYAKKGTVVKKAGMHKMPGGAMMKNSKMKFGGMIKTSSKMMNGGKMIDSAKMKAGGKMKPCKYGCN